MLNRISNRPDWLFLIIALPIGLLLCFLVPPLGGGNESLNFQRIAVIASGQPAAGPATVPRGIADFLNEGFAFFHEGLALPANFSGDTYRRMAEIELHADQPTVLAANPVSVHHPFSYLPQVAIFALAAPFGASPLVLFYLARVAGLLTALALTMLAIQRIPSHRFALAALALLPPITFGRSIVDADPVTNGLAFLFIATVLREIVAEGPIRLRNLVELAVLGFVFAQCKSAYFVLLALPLAIPASRFAGFRARANWLVLLILPGILGSLGWMLLVKQTVLSGVSYQTYSGAVNPDRQLALILSNPFDYLQVFFGTLFATDFFPRSLQQFIGAFGPPIVLNWMPCAILLLLLLGTSLSDGRETPRYPKSLPLLSIAIFAAFLALSLTLLYLQWTALGAPIIEGFIGRYFYPVMPLFLVLISTRHRVTSFGPAAWLLTLAGLGLTAMLWLTVRNYYA